jgi:predicted dehydrogenase
MNNKSSFSRRNFIGVSGIVGSGIALSGSTVLANSSQLNPLGFQTAQAGKKYKIGIIGCGNRSKAIIGALNSVPEIEIAALCDIVPHKMEQRAQLIKGNVTKPRYIKTVEELLKQSDLDAVAVITPNYTHKEIVIACLEAGKNVFCEKPMALTVADCNEMIGAVERTNKALQIGNQRRHSSVYKKLIEIIRTKPVGKILQSTLYDFRGDWRVPDADEYPAGTPYWRLDQKLSGGVVYEMGAHIIDVNNWLFDSEPESVCSLQGVNNFSLRKRDSSDHSGVIVQYANGAMMNYGSNVYNYGSDALDTFFGVGATVQMGNDKVVIKYGYPKGFDNPQKLPENEIIPLNGNNPESEGVVEELKHFAKVLAGEAKAYPDGHIAKQTVKICEASVRSAKERRVIDVRELG